LTLVVVVVVTPVPLAIDPVLEALRPFVIVMKS